MERQQAEQTLVVLIDFSALFRRAWHVSAGISVAFESTIGGVKRAEAAAGNPSLVAICCDGRGNWRKEIFPEYKAHRDKPDNNMYGEMDRTLERLRKDGRLIWKCDGFEADDLIATATHSALIRGHCVRIVSSDKDLMQLLNVKISFQAIHADGWPIVGPEKVREKFGVEPEQLGDWLALVGDTSDNVKGCPGVGPKTATEILNKVHSLDGMWYAIDPPKGTEPIEIGTLNVVKKLRENFAQIMKARKLVSLRVDAPIEFDEIYKKREQEDIAGTDQMSEAEKDADKYFGDSTIKRGDVPCEILDVVKDSETNGKAPDVADTGLAITATYPEQAEQGLSSKAVATPFAQAVEKDCDKIPGKIDSLHMSNEQVELFHAANHAPLVRQRDKTPEEIEQVSRPTELAPYVEYSKQLEPRSLRDAQVYARMMFNSKVYSRYPTVESMTAAIVRGREMGNGAGTSLDIFHVADFNNDGNLRLMMHAHLIIERVTQDPNVEYFMCVTDECDDTKATYEAKLKKWPRAQRFVYTIEDATKAGLVRLTASGKPNTWMKRPREQLRKTCGVQFGRIVSPGATIGLYCMEEMGIDNE